MKDKKTKVVVLGANGLVGKYLSQELRKDERVGEIIKVGRSFEDKVEKDFSYKKADLLDASAAKDAIGDADLVYMVVGLPYKTSTWREQWVPLMRNVLEAVKDSKSKLVFFDNVYAYGQVDGAMTEETPYNPTSKKGQIRKEVIDEIEKYKKQGVNVVIARSADYYGPDAKMSMLYTQMIENAIENKKPVMMGDPSTKHSFTYVPDAAKAMVTLGLDGRADNEVWHLPTEKPKTGKDYINIIGERLGNNNMNFGKMGIFLLTILSTFVPILREVKDMFYQYQNNYIFDSSKYQKVFGDVEPTTYVEGIKNMIESFR